MREKRNFAQRTKVLTSDEARKKYFLVYEGEETEQIYFDEVNLCRNEIGINPLIELVPVVRSYSEQGWSNPKKILDRILTNLKENESQIVSYETLLNWIMEYLHEEKILTTSKTQAKAMWDTLLWICAEKLHASLNDTIEDIESTCTQITNYFVDAAGINSIVDDVPKIIKNRAITYAEGLDKICFIVDRDRESFVSHQGNDQYRYVLNKCLENGFGFFLSNPCFEFWLLLHFDEVMNLDKAQLLENPKVTSKRRYTEQQLRALLPGYSKAKYDVEKLIQKIDVAIANEKKFCEDDQALEYSIGSKVGLLIEELRS